MIIPSVGKMRYMKPNNVGRPPKYPKNRLHFLIPNPPRCICGCSEYYFTVTKFSAKSGKIRARCKRCRYDRYFNPFSHDWGPKF